MVKIKRYAKLFFILVIAYFISTFFTREVFLSSSPVIRPNLVNHLVARFEQITKSKNILASLFGTGSKEKSQEATEKELELIPFKSVASGVRAKSKDNISIVEYELDSVQWVEYTFDIDGKPVMIKLPKGVQPPPKEMLENNY